MNRRSGHQKWDAKKMTMKKLIYYDSDLAPRFDDDDDDGKVSLSLSLYMGIHQIFSRNRLIWIVRHLVL